MVIRVNPVEKVVEWRWINMLLVAVGAFSGSLAWRKMLARKEGGQKVKDSGEAEKPPLAQRFMEDRNNFV